MYYPQGSLTDMLTETIMTLVIVSFFISVAIFLLIVLVLTVIIGALLYFVMRRWVIPLLQKPFEIPVRLFGAPATARWMLAYEYWLFLLEECTGVEFNTTPLRILAGCIIISFFPALIVGTALAILIPSTGGSLLFWISTTGLVVGLYTGLKLPNDGGGWFQPPSSGDDGGGFILGSGA